MRAQAGLGSSSSGDYAAELRAVPRGSAAAPVRAVTAAAEAPAAAAAPVAEAFPMPSLGHAGVSMEHVAAPVAADMDICRQNLLNVVGERHPMLLAAANQIFSAGGKRLRPLIVLLVARATYPLTGLRCAPRACLPGWLAGGPAGSMLASRRLPPRCRTFRRLPRASSPAHLPASQPASQPASHPAPARL